MVEDIKAVCRSLRERIALNFCKKYEQAVKMAAAVDVKPAIPIGVPWDRNTAAKFCSDCSRVPPQEYGNNTTWPSDNRVGPPLFCQLSVVPSTLWVVSFKPSVMSSTLLVLVPAVLLREDIGITDAMDMYLYDLPAPYLINHERLCRKLRGYPTHLFQNHQGVWLSAVPKHFHVSEDCLHSCSRLLWEWKFHQHSPTAEHLFILPWERNACHL